MDLQKSAPSPRQRPQPSNNGGGLDLVWRSVSMVVPTKQGPKTVLHALSGEALAGTVTAIMGPSGSGKSSLLNTLAGRVLYVKGATLTGEVELLRSSAREKAQLAADVEAGSASTAHGDSGSGDKASGRRLTAYVTQDDMLFPYMTVDETLLLAARLHHGPPGSSSSSSSSVPKRVEEALRDLGLLHVRHSIIGSATVRGVSGGERKRTAIGVELMCSPAVLFLDEPTSGLDAFAAHSVMTCLRDLAARQHKTVVASIHQPRQSIVESAVHRLVLLSQGRTLYQGSPHQAALAWFERLGLPCPDKCSPTDWFLDCAAVDYRSAEAEQASTARLARLASAWHEHEQGSFGSEHGDWPAGAEAVVGTKDRGFGGRLVDYCQGAAGSLATWPRQVLLLFQRGLVDSWRNRLQWLVKICVGAGLGLLLGWIFSGTASVGAQATQDRLGVLFFVAFFQFVASFISVLAAFPLEKPMVQKEVGSGAYSLAAYYVAKVMSDLPFAMLMPAFFGCLIYYITPLRPEAFGVFMATVFLQALAGTALGMVVGAMAPSLLIANALSPPFAVVFILMSGFIINVDSLPKGLKWGTSISMVRWSFQALVRNEFTGLTFHCPPTEPCLETGEQVISMFGFDQQSIATCLGWLGLIPVVLYCLGYVALRATSTRYLAITPDRSGQGSSKV